MYGKYEYLLDAEWIATCLLKDLIHGRIMNRVGKNVITASLTGVITQTDIDVIQQSWCNPLDGT